jgi:hypothetical protein
VVGTILGVITGVISVIQYAQDAFGGGGQDLSADQQRIYETLAAVQVANGQLSVQLTQYALAGVQSANEATANAINAQAASVQGTMGALQAKEDSLVATSNAQSAMTAAAEAVNSTATQAYLDAGATNAALSQIAPTPTDLPTATPVPEVVSDYRSLLDAAAQTSADGRIELSVQTAQNIPEDPPTGLQYVWMLDTDRNPGTGLPVQDIGVDMTMTVRFDNGAWLGTGRALLVDGAEGAPIVFTNITVEGNRLIATIDPTRFGLVGQFDWVARAQSDNEIYPLLPEASHFTIQ